MANEKVIQSTSSMLAIETVEKFINDQPENARFSITVTYDRGTWTITIKF